MNPTLINLIHLQGLYGNHNTLFGNPLSFVYIISHDVVPTFIDLREYKLYGIQFHSNYEWRPLKRGGKYPQYY